MNGFKLISSKQIIGELFSDFNITNDDWVNKAQRHMARALEIMKVAGYQELAVSRASVEEFKAPIPCDVKYLLAVLYNEPKWVRLNLTHSLSLGANFKDLGVSKIAQGGVNYNFLHTNFDSGEIAYVYYRLPKDANGDLMIPDNADVLEALPFFIIYKLSLSGYKHPVISIEKAEARWRELYPRARNSMNYPSVEEMHRFTKMNTNPLFGDIIDEDWFNGDIQDLALPFTDLITTKDV